MVKKVVVTKRFRNNIFRIYEYLLKKFSAKTAYIFLLRVEKRIEFIAKNPEIGKLSKKKKNVRSVLLTPYNQIFYRYQHDTVEVLCLFDMRKNPKTKPY